MRGERRTTNEMNRKEKDCKSKREERFALMFMNNSNINDDDDDETEN